MKMTKRLKVLEHLKEYGKITSWEAIMLYKATRLSAIIFNLKNVNGYNIVSEKVSKKDENGEVVNFVVYHFRGGASNE